MAIDFECPFCLAMLRVDERFAARSIECPACRDRVSIPELPEDDFELEWADVAEPTFSVCDLCGTRNLPEAVNCRSCGDPLQAVAKDGRRHTDATISDDEVLPPASSVFGLQDLLVDGWNLYRRDFGPCVLGYLVSMLVWVIGFIGGMIPVGMIGLALQLGPGNGLAGFVLIALIGFVFFLVTTYSQIGLMIYYEHLARYGRGDLGLLFHGSRFLGRMMLLNLLQTLFLLAGLLAFVVPGLIAHAVYWPASFVLVERDCTVMQSLEYGRRISRGHRGTLLAVSLFSLLVTLFGVFVAGIGCLVTTPLVNLLWTSGYLRMSRRQSDSWEHAEADVV